MGQIFLMWNCGLSFEWAWGRTVEASGLGGTLVAWQTDLTGIGIGNNLFWIDTEVAKYGHKEKLEASIDIGQGYTKARIQL